MSQKKISTAKYILNHIEKNKKEYYAKVREENRDKLQEKRNKR